MAEPIDQIQELLTVAARSNRRAVNAGRRNPDRLLRALVPLYLLRHTKGPLALNSGDVSRFWAARGVHVSASNVCGAFSTWIGYARHLARPRPADGWAIVPNGVKYVEAALAPKLPSQAVVRELPLPPIRPVPYGGEAFDLEALRG